VAFSGYTENFKVIAIDQVYKSPLSGQLRQIKKSSKAREHLKKKKKMAVHPNTHPGVVYSMS
jgi:hypothetical protein